MDLKCKINYNFTCMYLPALSNSPCLFSLFCTYNYTLVWPQIMKFLFNLRHFCSYISHFWTGLRIKIVLFRYNFCSITIQKGTTLMYLQTYVMMLVSIWVNITLTPAYTHTHTHILYTYVFVTISLLSIKSLMKCHCILHLYLL